MKFSLIFDDNLFLNEEAFCYKRKIRVESALDFFGEQLIIESIKSSVYLDIDYLSVIFLAIPDFNIEFRANILS